MRYQIITWTNNDSGNWALSNPGTNFSIQEKAFENDVCEIVSICSGLNVLLEPFPRPYTL